MEYRLYLMTANGWKYQGTDNLDGILFVLEAMISDEPNKQIIVIEHDIERNMDNTFYVHTGNLNDFLEWKSYLLDCVEKNKVR